MIARRVGCTRFCHITQGNHRRCCITQKIKLLLFMRILSVCFIALIFGCLWIRKELPNCRFGRDAMCLNEPKMFMKKSKLVFETWEGFSVTEWRVKNTLLSHLLHTHCLSHIIVDCIACYWSERQWNTRFFKKKQIPLTGSQICPWNGMYHQQADYLKQDNLQNVMLSSE